MAKLKKIEIECSTTLTSENEVQDVLEQFINELQPSLYLEDFGGNPVHIFLDRPNRRLSSLIFIQPPDIEIPLLNRSLTDFLEANGFSNCNIAVRDAEQTEGKLARFRDSTYAFMVRESEADDGIRTRALIWSRSTLPVNLMDAILTVMIRARETETVGDYTGSSPDDRFRIVWPQDR